MPDGAQPVDTFSFRTVIILHACAIALFVFGTGAGEHSIYILPRPADGLPCGVILILTHK